MIELYGIPNCDTVKKARTWLIEHEVNYAFHDFKKQAISEALLVDWLQQIGWQRLLKKTGPTWNKLPAEVKASNQDDASALELMLTHPNVIKRPVLTRNGEVLATGYNLSEYDNLKL